MKTSTPTTAPTTLTLRVEGMDCGGCERKVVSALERLEGIEEVTASSVTGSVKIHHHDHGAPRERPLRAS